MLRILLCCMKRELNIGDEAGIWPVLSSNRKWQQPSDTSVRSSKIKKNGLSMPSASNIFSKRRRGREANGNVPLVDRATNIQVASEPSGTKQTRRKEVRRSG